MSLQNLLSKKQTFEYQYEELQGLLIKLKQSNDTLQRNMDIDLDGDHQQLLILQKSKCKELLDAVGGLVKEIERSAKSYDQKKQMKTIKQFYLKENDRHKQITKEFNKRSRIQVASDEDDDHQDHQEYNKVFPFSEQQQQQQHMPVDHQQVDLDNQLFKERQHDIDYIDGQAHRLNSIVGQLASNVDEQDSHLDIITSELLKTKCNVQKANEEITEANVIQQQNTKKYYMFAFMILILVSGVFGTFVYYDILQ